jgi:hypothetical protein
VLPQTWLKQQYVPSGCPVQKPVELEQQILLATLPKNIAQHVDPLAQQVLPQAWPLSQQMLPAVVATQVCPLGHPQVAVVPEPQT